MLACLSKSLTLCSQISTNGQTAGRAAVGLPYIKGQTSVITGIAIIQSDTALKRSLGAGGLQSKACR